MTTVRVALAALAAVVSLAGCGTGGRQAATPPPGARATTTTAGPATDPVAALRPVRIAERVARLRQLPLVRRPTVREVSPRESQREQRRDSRRGSTARERATDEEVATILGLLPRGTSLEQLAATVSGEGVLGYYDPTRGDVSVLDSGRSLPKNGEATLAHELTHAVDDQHFHLERLMRRTHDGDAQGALSALIEGSAEDTAQDYARRYHVPQDDPGDAAKGEALKRKLPFGLLLELSFPYELGQRFVAALIARSGGNHDLVDRALRRRPPRTTLQILDPGRYLRGDRPERVRLDPERTLGQGWRRRRETTFGALDTATVTTASEGQLVGSLSLATKWRGGRYALLGRGRVDPRACPAPCVRRNAFLGAVRWSDAAAAQRFSFVYQRSLVRRRHARVAAPEVWQVAGAFASVHVAGRTTTIAYAPAIDDARGLARRGVRR